MISVNGIVAACHKAHASLTKVFMLHSSYFIENKSTANYLIHLVNTMLPVIGIIILQLLCAVPARLNRVMATLAFDGMSLNSLSPDERASIPTVLAFDELFKNFTERIVVFNCRDICVEDTKLVAVASAVTTKVQHWRMPIWFWDSLQRTLARQYPL